jgi:hypothetical protein
MSRAGQRYRTARRLLAPLQGERSSGLVSRSQIGCGARFLNLNPGLSTRSRAQPERSAKSCTSMSRASRKRTRARTGLLKPTNTCPRLLAQHLTLAVRVGVPELVTNCCSDCRLHPMKRFPGAPWVSQRDESSFCIDMSHVRTEQ